MLDKTVRYIGGMTVCLLAFMAVSGCGMTTLSFVDQFKGKTIFVEGVQIAMPVVSERNASSQHRSIPPGLDKSLRSEIIDRLQTEGNVKVISSKSDADILLTAEITDYIREGVTIQDDNQINDYRLRMNAHVTYYDTRTGKDIISSDVSEDSSYELGSDRNSDKTSALTTLLSRVARKIVGVLLDQW